MTCRVFTERERRDLAWAYQSVTAARASRYHAGADVTRDDEVRATLGRLAAEGEFDAPPDAGLAASTPPGGLSKEDAFVLRWAKRVTSRYASASPKGVALIRRYEALIDRLLDGAPPPASSPAPPPTYPPPTISNCATGEPCLIGGCVPSRCLRADLAASSPAPVAPLTDVDLIMITSDLLTIFEGGGFGMVRTLRDHLARLGIAVEHAAAPSTETGAGERAR